MKKRNDTLRWLELLEENKKLKAAMKIIRGARIPKDLSEVTREFGIDLAVRIRDARRVANGRSID